VSRTGAIESELRALFVNQGAIASRRSADGNVLGHVSVERALVQGMGAVDGIAARFARMPPWGGLARGLARPVPGLGRFDLDAHAVRWHLVESLRGRRFIERLLIEEPADVLHVDSHTPALLPAGVTRNVPTLLSVDAPVWDWHRMGTTRPARAHSRALLAPSIALERRAFARAAAIVARSRWAAEAVLREQPGARVEVIHPGVDTARFAPAARQGRTVPRVLFVGGRFREKGGEDLLRALGADLGRRLELDVVSPVELQARPGLQLHRRLGPATPELVALFQQADVVCLPTHGDSFGWTVLEAMACGVPVVATPVGAIPDLLGDGSCGTLVPVGDHEQLRAAIWALLADEAMRAEQGANARARIERDYDVRRQGHALATLMRAVA
jgi:glycosyltransferase involved in cell wall biosynthesis